jgi:hypothetical protein
MAHQDLDALLNALLPFAQQMLAKHGEFYPFGATMASDGQVAMSAGYTGSERPASIELIEILKQGFRSTIATTELRAAGLCFDVRVTPPNAERPTDAIQASLQRASGEAVDVFLPYHKGLFGKLKYGALFAGPGTLYVFQAPGLN